MNEQKTFSLNDYDETIREVLESGGVFRIYPRGISMLPLLREGIDSVLLEKPNGMLKKDDIAFYRRDDGSYILHRVLKADNSYTICGDHQLTPEKGIEQHHIIGRVCAIYRGEKELRMNSLKYNLYCLLWRSFLIRRIYFKLYRIKHGK